MHMKALAIALLLMQVASAYGWGALVTRLTRLRGVGISVTTAVGLGVVICLGGALNVARIATPVGVGSVTLVGLILAARSLQLWAVSRRGQTDQSFANLVLSYIRPRVPTLVVIVITMGALAWLLLPARVFNLHDDFHKYFAHPERMLQTGTVFGSSMSAIGSETLGGMAFLQGWLAAWLPIEYISAVDGVIGLLLCMTLAAGLAGRHGMGLLGGLAAAAVLVIDPQIVNVSALYLGSAFMLAAIGIVARAADVSVGTPRASAISLGVLYAGLAALKPTLAIFALLHGVCMVITLRCARRSMSQILRWSVLTGVTTGAAILPWVALHWPRYSSANSRLFALADARDFDPPGEVIDILSTAPLLYGSSVAMYTLLVAAAIVASALGLWVHAGASDVSGRLRGYAACSAGFILFSAFCFFIFVLSPRISGVIQSVRYLTPYAIALVPAVLALLNRDATVGAVSKTREMARWAAAGVILAATGWFVLGLSERWGHVRRIGSLIAFHDLAQRPDYVEYNRKVLQGEMAELLHRAQSAVPEREPIIAWVNTPFHFDFRRNPVHDIELAGLGNRWAEMPPTRYVIWQYAGLATISVEDYRLRLVEPGDRERFNAKRGLTAVYMFDRMARQSEELFREGGIIVFRCRDEKPIWEAP